VKWTINMASKCAIAARNSKCGMPHLSSLERLRELEKKLEAKLRSRNAQRDNARESRR